MGVGGQGLRAVWSVSTGVMQCPAVTLFLHCSRAADLGPELCPSLFCVQMGLKSDVTLSLAVVMCGNLE